jgi:hypothetical protein
MINSYRRPLLLVLATALLVCAVAAYLIGDAQVNTQRQGEALRDEKIVRDQNERSIADRAVMHNQAAKLSEHQNELTRHNLLTLELQRRLDELTGQVSALRGQLEKFESSRK